MIFDSRQFSLLNTTKHSTMTEKLEESNSDDDDDDNDDDDDEELFL